MNEITLSDIGSLSSILGFIVSVFVLYNLRVIVRSYMFKARVPALQKKLSTHTSHLIRYLNDFDGSIQSIKEELAKSQIVLNSLRRKLKRPAKGSVKQALKLIDTYKKDHKNENKLRIVYIEMLKVVEEIKDLKADLKWER